MVLPARATYGYAGWSRSLETHQHSGLQHHTSGPELALRTEIRTGEPSASITSWTVPRQLWRYVHSLRQFQITRFFTLQESQATIDELFQNRESWVLMSVQLLQESGRSGKGCGWWVMKIKRKSCWQGKKKEKKSVKEKGAEVKEFLTCLLPCFLPYLHSRLPWRY